MLCRHVAEGDFGDVGLSGDKTPIDCRRGGTTGDVCPFSPLFVPFVVFDELADWETAPGNVSAGSIMDSWTDLSMLNRAQEDQSSRWAEPGQCTVWRDHFQAASYC